MNISLFQKVTPPHLPHKGVCILMGLKEADVQGILRITQHLCLTPENVHTGGKVLYWSLIGGRSQNA